MQHRLFVIFLLALILVSQPAVANQTYSQPIGFFLLEDGEDFFSVLPLGTKKDDSGNVHVWFNYIEPTLHEDQERLVVLYYAVISETGEVFIKELDRHPFSLSKVAFFDWNELRILPNGTVMGIFVAPSDFGVDLNLVRWNGNLSVITLEQQSEFDFSGDIIGPIDKPDENFLYLLDGEFGGSKSIMKLEFSREGNLLNKTVVGFPTLLDDSKEITDIFDATYANGTFFYSVALRENGAFDSLGVVSQINQTTVSLFAKSMDYNVKEIANIPFLRNLRQDILTPRLVATENGKLYSYLFGFDNSVNFLGIWTNGTLKDIFTNSTENPFQLSFFPLLSAIGDHLEIYFLGIQYAQDAISFTVDHFTYFENGTLTKEKFLDPNLSGDIFLFIPDPQAQDFTAIASTFNTPRTSRIDYGILNETVGGLYLLSSESLPPIEPMFFNLILENEQTTAKEFNPLIYLYPAIGSLMLLFAILTYANWRKRRLAIPPELQKLLDTKPELISEGKEVEKFVHRLRLNLIYLRSNAKRIIRTILIMFIPALLFSTLILGILTYQANLLSTYQAQNPLNDIEDLSLESNMKTDFTWTNLWFSDEFQESNFSEVDFAIPEQLSSQSLKSFGIEDLGFRLSSVVTFPLFEPVFLNLTFGEENIQVNLPFPREFGVVDQRWFQYLTDHLIRGRLPQHPGEVLVLDSWYVEPVAFLPDEPSGVIWDVGSTIEVAASELDVFLNSTVQGLKQNVTVVGVLERVESLPFSEVKEWTEKLNTTTKGLRLLDKVPFVTFSHLMGKFLNEFSRLSLRPTAHINMRYEVEKVNRDAIPELVQNLKEMGNETLRFTGFTWTGNYSSKRIVEFLEGYYLASRDIQLETVVLIVPILALAVLVTYDALGMNRLSITEEIRRFKREGMRTERIVLLLLAEQAMTTLASIILSLATVNYATQEMIRFTGYFEHGDVFVPQVTWEQLPWIGIGTFLGLFVLGSINSLTVLFRREEAKFETMLAGIQWDILAVIFGLSLVLISDFLTGFVASSLDEKNELASDLPFLTVKTISTIIATLGILLVLSKLLNRFFSIIGFVGWKTVKRKEGLIFKGFHMHIGLYGRLLIVFLISIFLVVPMFTIPVSLNNEYKVSAYNEFSTDISVLEWHAVPNLTRREVLGIDGIKSHSEYFIGIVPFANDLKALVLAINTSTFLSSIYVPNKYLPDYGINLSVVEDLKEGEWLGNKAFLERNAFDPGDRPLFRFEHTSKSYPMKVKAGFDQFPILKREAVRLNDPIAYPLQMVISLETLKEIQDIYLFQKTETSSETARRLEERNLLIRSKRIDQVPEMVEEIKSLTGRRIEHINTFINKQRHPFFRAFEFLTHLSLITAALSPLLATFVLAKLLFERRKDEWEVYYRIGISKGFFIFQVTLELILSTLLPSLLGIIVGRIWTENNGSQLFGLEGRKIERMEMTDWIYAWVGIQIILSLFIWIQQMNSMLKRHIKEVRL